MTTNHPAHGPVSLDRLHQISEILSKAAVQSDGGNLGYAMADAVKVIDVAIASFGAEPVLYAAEETLAYARMGEIHLKCLSQPMGDALISLYTHRPLNDEIGSWNNHRNTPTAKQAIDTGELLKHIEGMEVSVDVSTCDADAGHRYFGTVTEISELETAKNGFILLVQDAKPNFKLAVNHTEQHLDMVDSGWIPVSERMPEGMKTVITSNGFDIGQGWWDGECWKSFDCHDVVPGKVTHWMPLPAAPQQEG
ncbi:TPA: DUF551 domain-containing protein [Citrobacter freundii]